MPNETPHSLARIPLRWMIRECFLAKTVRTCDILYYLFYVYLLILCLSVCERIFVYIANVTDYRASNSTPSACWTSGWTRRRFTRTVSIAPRVCAWKIPLRLPLPPLTRIPALRRRVTSGPPRLRRNASRARAGKGKARWRRTR